ncbi:PLD nuclease N-terminal domain-containing protein [uncultured Roseivirga sp.]|uniref:PLD nuclease N-terminal domain-containing protein n=1 Tax=uncultured Roseivirga sp. TaxID=543088 RepID=UPI0030DD468E|tara:strand:- start:134479 stop:134694 length:216 start_codon:yes stop_codon:yes gene_type:complete
MHLLGMPGGAEMLIILFIISFPVILWIVALVDCLKSNFAGDSKVVWVLVIIFLPVLGSILYFLIGRNQKIA